MSLQRSNKPSTPKGNSNKVPLRAKSSRNKESDIAFPPDHRFLVYFECDGKFDIVKPNHTSWPKHMSSSVKLSMRYEDVPFKSDKNPKIFVNGLVVTNGPEEILTRVGNKMNVLLSEGVEPRDMNVTQVFQQAYDDIEIEKKTSSQVRNDEVIEEPFESCDSDDSTDDADEPDLPDLEVQKAKSVKNIGTVQSVTAEQVVNMIRCFDRRRKS